MQNKYKNLDNKLKKFSEKQITTYASNEIIKYFPRVINKTLYFLTKNILLLGKV